MSGIKLFEGHEIRVEWNNEEMQWYFSITDFIDILCECDDSRKKWRQLKKNYPEMELFCHGLRMPGIDGKKRIVDCTNKYGTLRILAVLPPSPGMVLFKKWLLEI